MTGVDEPGVVPQAATRLQKPANKVASLAIVCIIAIIWLGLLGQIISITCTRLYPGGFLAHDVCGNITHSAGTLCSQSAHSTVGTLSAKVQLTVPLGQQISPFNQYPGGQQTLQSTGKGITL